MPRGNRHTPRTFAEWVNAHAGPIFIGLATVAVLCLVVVALAAGRPAVMNASEVPPSTPRGTEVDEDEASVVSLGDALRGSDPVNIAVVGDSTGVENVQWVYTFARDIAESGRAVQVAAWNQETTAFDPATPIGEAVGEPVTIWNGSAAGRAPQYSREHLDALLPSDTTFDAIVVNHGFNTAGDGVTDISRLTDDIAVSQPAAPLILTLQNPRANATPEEQTAKHEGQKAWSQNNPSWTVVDVYTAFTSNPDALALYRDDRHPNEAGGRVWADTFKAAIDY